MNSVRTKFQVNFDPGQDVVFFWCENKAKVIRRPFDSTSGNLDKTNVREKSRGRLSGNWLSFSELFDDISLMLKVRRLCVVVGSLISAAKVCDCMTSAWC